MKQYVVSEGANVVVEYANDTHKRTSVVPLDYDTSFLEEEFVGVEENGFYHFRTGRVDFFVAAIDVRVYNWN